VQIDALTDAATGAVKMVRRAKALSRALYLLRRMKRAAQIARRNNYPFLQPKHLELLVEVNMTSRAKHG
jgi:hypothetical protein